MTSKMNCKCATQFVIQGKDALKKVEDDLYIVSVDPQNWIEVYKCKKCGKYWLGRYIHGEMHGGGILVLRKCQKKNCVDLINEERSP